MTSKYYGAEGRGYYSWWVLNFALLMHLSGLIGGSALAYFTPRRSLNKIFFYTYSWALLSSLTMSWLFWYLGKIEQVDLFHFIALGFIECLIGHHLFHLQGKQQLRTYNIAQVLSMLLLYLSLYITFMLKFSMRDTMLIAFYVSKVLTLLFIYIAQKPSETITNQEIGLKEMLRFSWVIQLANIVQFVNYRFTAYYLEHHYTNLFYLGVFSTAISVAEGLWLINRSISMVHYSKVSNTMDMQQNVSDTIRLIKYTMFIMFLAIMLFLLIPQILYIYFLGSDFVEVRRIVTILSPGILVFSISGIVSHFYSGIGENKYNVYASLSGAIASVTLGLILIPYWGIEGAAITNVLAYGINVFVLLWYFTKAFQVKWIDIIPKSQDIKDILAILKKKSRF